MLRFTSCYFLCQAAFATTLKQVTSGVAACHPDLSKEILVAIAVENEPGFLLYLSGSIGSGHLSVGITTIIRALDHQPVIG